MTALIATGCLIAAVSGAGIVLITYCETVDRRRRRRHAREDAARDHAIQVRRVEDWKALKAEWLGADFDAAPVLSHDPERLS